MGPQVVWFTLYRSLVAVENGLEKVVDETLGNQSRSYLSQSMGVKVVAWTWKQARRGMCEFELLLWGEVRLAYAMDA